MAITFSSTRLAPAIRRFLRPTGALLALSLTATSAHAVDVTVAYQTSAEPAKVAQADNSFAKLSGAKVDWRKFDSGSSVVRALASGDVQIGNIGSSPLAVAASQNVPIEVFLLASQLGSSEALVVKKEIKTPQDLIGKRIAVPFISTTHYSLLAALKHWGIKPDQVTILNLQPPAIAAAWQRGDIDGAYVWAPAVNELAKNRYGANGFRASGPVGRTNAGCLGST
ncbi:taurine transporter substrate binding subunit [Yersinia intermedia]|uniref:Taurine transporter substrate binding subunit n=1 Tax=Yersinia intermedia TaxID=631 RepID=A0A0H5LZY9_YERIN|nr:taurine transporter substrate binding subunit [Yersinia intermedia]